MLQSLHLSAAAPELTLAIGAMALLMLGVATRKEQGALVLWLAVLVLAAAGILVALGSGTTTLFGGSFIVDPFARAMKLLTLTGAAGALIMSYDYWRETGHIKFEFPVLVLLISTGMLMMISANDLIALYVGLELQSPGAVCDRGLRPRFPPLERGGAQIFRARRALLGHAALWRLAHLWLHRLDRIRRASPRRFRAAAPISALSSASCFSWRALPSRSRRCPSICGRPTSMKARRPPSPPSSPRHPSWPPWRSRCALCSPPSRTWRANGSRS